MFKILVIVTTSGGLDGGRAAAMETLSFDTGATANVALRQLQDNCVSGMTVIPLFKTY